ncbi:MAG: hypothetical protein J3K34DRAFT_411889 [Monoraphidium minutum]|nr:MAG: hypothetical protein J3K34DRAFT_411889 [Monoraphidium minutum]
MSPLGMGGAKLMEPDLSKLISSPATPRAHVVPSRERPEGHYATPKGRTPLMQHLDFFDLAALPAPCGGAPQHTLCVLARSRLPPTALLVDPDQLVPVAAAHYPHPQRDPHDAARARLQVFEDTWQKYAHGKQRMTPRDVAALVWGSARRSNPFGVLASAFQWGLALWLFHDDAWCLRKNDVRGLYDGTAFYRLADRCGNPWAGMAARRDAVSHHNMG